MKARVESRHETDYFHSRLDYIERKGHFIGILC